MPAVIGHRCPQNHPCPLVLACPTGAISQKGFAAPVIDGEKCVDCDLCTVSCAYRAVVAGWAQAGQSPA
jgi:Fe-S-cluster-containing hydrogenase component 2